MVVKQNYPLSKGEFQLDRDTLLNYIHVFENHSISYALVEKKVLFSDHTFTDGLKIKIQWLIRNPQLFRLSELEGVAKLLELKGQEIIDCSFARITHYSKGGKEASKNLHNLFVEKVLKQSSHTLSKEEYYKLEYGTKEKSSISEEEFEEFFTAINNYILFEQYYEQRDKNTI